MIVDRAELAETLPGRWEIHATDFPMWLAGSRNDPSIRYRLRAEDPLVLDDVVEYRHETRGARTITGRDRLGPDGFVWCGVGPLAVLRSRWGVAGIDGPVLAIRFARSLVTPAGVDILVREGVRIPSLRRDTAARLDALGLAPEEFASLSWIRD